MTTEREPDILLLTPEGNIIAVFFCPSCGKPVVQRTTDEIDRLERHLANCGYPEH